MERLHAGRLARPSREGLGRLLLLGALLLAGVLGSSLYLSRFATAPAEGAVDPSPPGRGATPGGSSSPEGAVPATHSRASVGTVEEQWGLRIVRLAVVADGGIIDLRYQVLDPAKAEPVLDPTQPAFLQEESTGQVVSTARLPKIGELRQKLQQSNPDRVYFMGFGNSGGIIKSGSRVSLILGGYRLEQLVVR